MTTATHHANANASLAGSSDRAGDSPALAVRRSPWLARAGAGLSAAGQWLWQALEAVGHRRASRVLMLSAQQWDLTDKAMAAKLRAAARWTAES